MNGGCSIPSPILQLAHRADAAAPRSAKPSGATGLQLAHRADAAAPRSAKPSGATGLQLAHRADAAAPRSAKPSGATLRLCLAIGFGLGVGCAPGSEDEDQGGASATDAMGGSSSGPDVTTTGMDPGGTETTGTTSVDTDADGSTGEETDGDVDPRPPEVAGACDTPVATTTSTRDAAAERRFDGVTMAYSGATVALLYAESTGESTWTVWLQRLDPSGEALDERIDLGPTTLTTVDPIGFPPPRPWLSLTAIADTFVACWTGADGGSSIACTAVDDAGTVSEGLVTLGRNPGVATGPAGVGLVYTVDNEFVSRRLDPFAVALEQPHVVFSVSGTDLEVRPDVAGTSTGYVAGADILLPRFDEMFREREGDAASGWTSLPVSLAGSGDVVGAAWGSLDGVQARVLLPDAEEFGDPARIDGLEGNTSAATTVIARADDSFAILWSVDFGTAGPTELLEVVPRSDALALTATADGFLGAAVLGSGQEELSVLAIACP
jgi:hypothetical protein